MRLQYIKPIILPVVALIGFVGTDSVSASIDEAATLVEAGRLEEAASLLSESKDPARFLWQGRIAFLNYDFPEATRLYSQYKKALGKGTPSSALSDFSRQLSMADQALESVAEIEVIDSIVVPASDFISAIRIPHSAGRIAEPDEIPLKGRADVASSVFFNERGDFALWSEPDTTGTYRITESSRLVDGTWSEPIQAPELLNSGGDADYPFMCADGTTLYFAADGEDSFGGFDLFIASRSANDGEYLKPRNLGMPFNSPYDDLMMAIDEENGLGWWVTDRNRIPDKLTIYVYKLAESRNNIDSDDDNLIALARLSDISMTQNEETDYTSLKRKIASIRPYQPSKPVEFRFNIPGRGEITSYSDLRTAEGRQMMKTYQKAVADAEGDRTRLSELRAKYREAVGSGGRKALAQEILDLESREKKTQDNLKSLRNKIYRTEVR